MTPTFTIGQGNRGEARGEGVKFRPTFDKLRI